MRIVICDDNYSTINFVHNSLERLAKTYEWNVEFVLTTRKHTSVQQFLTTRCAEVYYINIDLKNGAGIALAEEIRQKDPQAEIILLSASATTLSTADDSILRTYQMLLQEQTTRFEKRLLEGFTELYNQKG
ncbi:response regulator [Kurthia huakuii]|uniref:response regulator n=1 Tax=Kurthia huakuii TaxID=1421019 RepID=UPI000495BBDD|nr:response regulator [Kurthia huakuii]MBM7698211.1 DNA-binding LytR/AlgR family response regulator [Kurthia huakuii]